jgi:hypothetical protein
MPGGDCGCYRPKPAVRTMLTTLQCGPPKETFAHHAAICRLTTSEVGQSNHNHFMAKRPLYRNAGELDRSSSIVAETYSPWRIRFAAT